jgi:hypothetical protein
MTWLFYVQIIAPCRLIFSLFDVQEVKGERLILMGRYTIIVFGDRGIVFDGKRIWAEKINSSLI